MPRRSSTRLSLVALVALGSLVGLAALLASCSGERPAPVVVYVSADETVALPIIDAFEKATGIDVVAKFDTEATKTTGLASLLRQEAARPRADVFWSSEVFATVQLANEGVLAAHEDPGLEDWPEAFRDPARRWYGFAARARVIAYAPERVRPEDVPRAWSDLVHERWRGRLVMADPRFGTTRGHLGAMKSYWDREFMAGYFAAWAEGVAENDVRLLTTGNAGVVEAIVAGEADIGMTDSDDIWAAQARGSTIELVYARHDSDPDARNAGTLLIPNTVAKVAGGPNPAGAGKLIAWLLSAEVEQRLLESDSHNVPIRPERLSPEARRLAERFEVPDPLRVNYERAAGQMDGAVELMIEKVRPRR